MDPLQVVLDFQWMSVVLNRVVIRELLCFPDASYVPSSVSVRSILDKSFSSVSSESERVGSVIVSGLFGLYG